MIRNKQQLIEALKQPIPGISDEMRKYFLEELDEAVIHHGIGHIPKMCFKQCVECALGKN